MGKFKKGDRIIPNKEMCEGMGDYYYKTFTVIHTYRDQVDVDGEFVIGRNGEGWWEERFELDKSQIVHNLLKDL